MKKELLIIIALLILVGCRSERHMTESAQEEKRTEERVREIHDTIRIEIHDTIREERQTKEKSDGKMKLNNGTYDPRTGVITGINEIEWSRELNEWMQRVENSERALVEVTSQRDSLAEELQRESNEIQEDEERERDGRPSIKVLLILGVILWGIWEYVRNKH